MRSNSFAAVALAALLVLAGCTGGFTGDTATPSADSTADSQREATSVVVTRADGVNFYVSDEENAIDQFRHLNVTITRVGFERAEGGWVERDVGERTVDLTRLQGANATRLTTVDAPNGTYQKVFARVSDVDATLATGESVRVKLPSERLQLDSEFTVGDGESVDFVFDISVHEAGDSGKYVLKPVVGESGTDVPIEPVDEELDVEFLGDVTPGGNATLEVTGDDAPVENATVSVDGETVGTTGADGRVTVEVPDERQFDLAVTAGDRTADLRVTFERDDGETEAEVEDEDDESEDDREVETEFEGLEAAFVGEVVRGENATVEVTGDDGAPVENATVVVNGETVGTTDADGRLSVPVPGDDLEVEVSDGEREAELEVESGE